MTDLWDTICEAAERTQAERVRPRNPAKKPTTPTPAEAVDPGLLERALLDALCGGMTQWIDDAQVFILHHWQCACCGATGDFPNLGPRMIRRHNRAGTSWTAHTEHPFSPDLPVEFQHHYHEASWCPSCVRETNPHQSTFHFPSTQPPIFLSNSISISMRIRPYV